MAGDLRGAPAPARTADPGNLEAWKTARYLTGTLKWNRIRHHDREVPPFLVVVAEALRLHGGYQAAVRFCAAVPVAFAVWRPPRRCRRACLSRAGAPVSRFTSVRSTATPMLCRLRRAMYPCLKYFMLPVAQPTSTHASVPY